MSNREASMMTSAVNEAKNILLDQTVVYTDAKTFQKVMDWLDTAPMPSETEGMRRILQAKAPWQIG